MFPDFPVRCLEGPYFTPAIKHYMAHIFYVLSLIALAAKKNYMLRACIANPPRKLGSVSKEIMARNKQITILNVLSTYVQQCTTNLTIYVSITSSLKLRLCSMSSSTIESYLAILVCNLIRYDSLKARLQQSCCFAKAETMFLTCIHGF